MVLNLRLLSQLLLFGAALTAVSLQAAAPDHGSPLLVALAALLPLQLAAVLWVTARPLTALPLTSRPLTVVAPRPAASRPPASG